ncbi:hypothetical protein ACE1TI_12780 [Alteribacillus sp. JSM 102045]|uniref:hypothetical protein n=1 Tax=Alteribacillus sp. JSM 102045 TaxID=1562101 RepID=UPI0035C23007
MKWIYGLLLSIGIICGCASGQQDNALPVKQAEKADTRIEEKQPPSEVKSVSQKQIGAETFNELIESFHEFNYASYLNQEKEEIKEALGEPEDEGWFEGGEYMQYGDFTFFFHPVTEKGISVAVETTNKTFDQEKAEDILGSVDRSFWNEMDNMWSEVYEFEDGTITFEKESEEAEHPSYIWFESSK